MRLVACGGSGKLYFSKHEVCACSVRVGECAGSLVAVCPETRGLGQRPTHRGVNKTL